MIFSTCPLRVSLCGGGSDLPSISEKLHKKGASIGFSSNLKMSVIGHNFIQNIILKYSDIEEIKNLNDIKHSIYKEVLKRVHPQIKNYQLVSICDVAGGTGLGSSSSFTVSLLGLIFKKLNKEIKITDLAMLAAEAEIEWCGNNIGLQDQFLGALGGLNKLEFLGMSKPKITKLDFPSEWTNKNTSPFILYKISGTHSSSEQLKSADKFIEETQLIRDLVPYMQKAIKNGDIPEIAKIVGKNWEIKKHFSSNNDIPLIGEVLNSAKLIDPNANGKLLGSGGGGFFLIVSENASKIREKLGEKCLPICVDYTGLRVKEI